MKTVSIATLSRRADRICAAAFWLSIAFAFWGDWRMGIAFICFAASQDGAGCFLALQALALFTGHKVTKNDDHSGDT